MGFDGKIENPGYPMHESQSPRQYNQHVNQQMPLQDRHPTARVWGQDAAGAMLRGEPSL